MCGECLFYLFDNIRIYNVSQAREPFSRGAHAFGNHSVLKNNRLQNKCSPMLVHDNYIKQYTSVLIHTQIAEPLGEDGDDGGPQAQKVTFKTNVRS